jgi:hypothetical protein
MHYCIIRGDRLSEPEHGKWSHLCVTKSQPSGIRLPIPADITLVHALLPQTVLIDHGRNKLDVLLLSIDLRHSNDRLTSPVLRLALELFVAITISAVLSLGRHVGWWMG